MHSEVIFGHDRIRHRRVQGYAAPDIDITRDDFSGHLLLRKNIFVLLHTIVCIYPYNDLYLKCM